MWTLAAGLLLALGPELAAPVPPKTTIKLATLVPEGSVWDKTFRKMGSEWKRDTDGRVQLRMYAGGVAGDEPDIVRKMRIGQLGGAALTVSGLGEIDPAFKLFEVPLLFETEAEAQHVVAALTPMLRESLAARGFHLLHWGNTGWIHFFSTKPVRSLDDLKRLKMFVWGGNNNMVQWWKENGFHPVPLAVTDLLTSVETGMVEAFPVTPLTALSLQWFRSAPHMMDLGVMPYFGATIISDRVWKKISKEDRAALRAAGGRAETHLNREVPKQEQQAITEMEKRGLSLTKVLGSPGEASFRSAAASFATSIKERSVPPEVVARAIEIRDAYRAGEAGGESSD